MTGIRDDEHQPHDSHEPEEHEQEPIEAVELSVPGRAERGCEGQCPAGQGRLDEKNGGEGYPTPSRARASIPR